MLNNNDPLTTETGLDDELERSIESFYIEMSKDLSLEMACIGYVKRYAINVYTREYEHEDPHFTITDHNDKNHPLAKVIIPYNDFKKGDEFDVRYKNKNFSFNKAFKKDLTDWLLDDNEDAPSITNLIAIRLAWNTQARQYEGTHKKSKTQSFKTPTAKKRKK
jgi:hypothetical protein